MKEVHRWTFIRTGGVDQVLIRNGADIVALESLDQKLWVALACPTRGIEIDARTLDLIDSDRDGRIRAPEIVEATRWVRDHFRDPDDLVRGGDVVALAAINAQTAAGERLAEEARRILRVIAKPGAESISLADLTDLETLLAKQPFNGDGVIPPSAVTDPAARALIETIVATHGGVADRNGELGVDRATAAAFFAEVDALQAWRRKGEADPAVLPLGERTPAAAEAVAAVRAKVDDFFVRCRLAAYDPLAGPALNPAESSYRGLAVTTLDAGSQPIAQLPLAIVRPGRTMPLDDGLNPAWRQAIATLRREAVEPLLGAGATEFDETQWQRLLEMLAPCGCWLDARPATKLESLEAPRVTAISVADRAAIDALIQQDEAVAEKNARVVELERLLRYQRDLVHLLNNFVSFAEFYSGQNAIFEAGTLYLDGRSCDLTVYVADPAKHAVLAGLAKAYLAYCECTRPGARTTIVAAFTAGDVDFLLVGRNGIFYDRKGQDWDATITKIIENPISIRQAFLSPYKKFSRLIEEQVAKRAAASASGVQSRLTSLATETVHAPPVPGVPATATATVQRRVDVGTVAALGVALGSISTVLVGVFAKFVDLGWWIPVALAGIVLAISGPSMLIAWLKLRQRSLGPILDASGWAINGRMKINVPLGASLSKTAQVPPGAQRRMRDPFADPHKGPWSALLVLVILGALFLAWRMDRLNPVLPEFLWHRTPPAVEAAPPT